MEYIGRFAPSPTGQLHFGSLLAALASFLDARAHNGRWLLRIEDLDPPREQPGALHSFPVTLEAFGLYWDDELTRQSERLHFYQGALQQLLKNGDAYPCSCSRKQLHDRSGGNIYDGFCRRKIDHTDKDAAIRVHCPTTPTRFLDLIQGPQTFNLANISGDFVVLRKDKLFAYQLAVVTDDHLQGITHIVRGSDLLPETPKQIHLQDLLGINPPRYAHIPVAANHEGQKLSKQTYATALNLEQPLPQLIEALHFLNQSPDPALVDASVDELLKWAVTHWKMEHVPSVLQQIRTP